jgi:predicted house-cleaning noncanonical NTP pyrophosphatase (MazG superfamily)
MPTFLFNKLVRDDILQRSLDDPLVIKVDYRTLDDEEYRKELIAKIHEEANEIPIRDKGDEEILSELADVQAVVDALRELYGYTVEQVAQAQRSKFEKNGGFALRAYVVSVELDENSEWVGRFRAQPEKYVEVK